MYVVGMAVHEARLPFIGQGSDNWFLERGCNECLVIGINGTCHPNTIGTRTSNGCIRLHNRDIVRLKQLVSVGTKVIILPDKHN